MYIVKDPDKFAKSQVVIRIIKLEMILLIIAKTSLACANQNTISFAAVTCVTPEKSCVKSQITRNGYRLYR